MAKIRTLRLDEQMIVDENETARQALAELEESGDAVHVILRLAKEMREKEEEISAIILKMLEQFKKIETFLNEE